MVIIIILWLILSLLVAIQCAPACRDLETNEKIIVGIIFIIGGPILAAADILETILDYILPEDWDNGISP